MAIPRHQVFMTRRNSLQTIHEPFGDAYYFGPERMGSRFEDDEKAREESGFADSTFKTILDRIEREAADVCWLSISFIRIYSCSTIHLFYGHILRVDSGTFVQNRAAALT